MEQAPTLIPSPPPFASAPSAHPTPITTSSQKSSPLLTAHLKNKLSSIANTTEQYMFSNVNSTQSIKYKIMKGPDGCYLVGVFMEMQRDSRDKGGPAVLYYFSLLLVTVEFQVLGVLEVARDRVWDLAGFVGSSNFVILYANRIYQYSLVRQRKEPQTYQSKLQNMYELATDKQVRRIRYSPDGKKIIGYLSNKQEKTLQILKLELLTKNITVSANILGNCTTSQFFKDQPKWTLTNNRYLGDHVGVVGGLDVVCGLQLSTMEVTVYNVSQIFTTPPPLSLSSIFYIQSCHKPLVLALSPSTKSLLILSAQAPPTALITLPIPASTKCIHLSQIDSLACMHYNDSTVQILKMDLQRKKITTLGTVSSDGSPVQDIVEGGTNKQSLCLLYGDRLHCFGLAVGCGGGGQSLSIADCGLQCASQESSLSWDPVTMTCMKFPSCPPFQQYNPSLGKCQVQCNKIDNSYKNSVYKKGKECACTSYFRWYPQLHKCRFNCSSIPFTDPQTDLSSLGPQQCKCKAQFKFIQKLGSQDSGGMCQFVCQNGKDPQWVNNTTVVCTCFDSGKWDPEKRVCVDQSYIGRAENMLLVLVAFITIFLFSGLIFVIVKLVKKCVFRSQVKRREIPQVSERNEKIRQRRTQENILEIRNCEICKLEDPNCKGPCGHFYHFYCIRQKINESKQCPHCGKQFPQGLTDIQLVQKQNEMFQISEK